MNGHFCTSCGASVEGVRFCTSCGTPVQAPQPDPYEYLFAEPKTAAQPAPPQGAPRDSPTVERPVVRAGWDRLPPAPVMPPPRRRSFGWPWVVAAAVVLAAVVALGISLTTSGTHTTADSPTRPPVDAGTPTSPSSPSSPRATSSPSASRSASRSPSAAHAPARVAAQVRGLIAQEVAAHRADNAAVGALFTCTNLSGNRQTVASFVNTRRELVRRLAAVAPSSNPQLNVVMRRLLGTWRALTPVDSATATWARSVRRTHHKCRVPVLPDTSQASKNNRHQLRDTWVSLLHAHPGWGVAQVPALVSARDRGFAYLLL